MAKTNEKRRSDAAAGRADLIMVLLFLSASSLCTFEDKEEGKKEERERRQKELEDRGIDPRASSLLTKRSTM